MFDLKAAGQPAQAKAAPDQLWLISMALLHERAGRFDSNPARPSAPFTCNVIAPGHLQHAWDKVSMTSEPLSAGNHETSLDKASGQIQKLALPGKETGLATD